ARYQIQSRQYDGDLGVPSPAVRREYTRDRAFVSRTAALLVQRDVGLTGTITSEPDSDRRVRVEWRGGGLGVEMGKWLDKGQVLCLVTPRSSSTVASAVLQIETAPKDGASTCVLFSRFRLAKATGLRCMLLGTRSGPVRLRLLQPKGNGKFDNLDSDALLEFR